MFSNMSNYPLSLANTDATLYLSAKKVKRSNLFPSYINYIFISTIKRKQKFAVTVDAKKKTKIIYQSSKWYLVFLLCKWRSNYKECLDMRINEVKRLLTVYFQTLASKKFSSIILVNIIICHDVWNVFEYMQILMEIFLCMSVIL